MLFFIKYILWNQKIAVILHAELRTLFGSQSKRVFY